MTGLRLLHTNVSRQLLDPIGTAIAARRLDVDLVPLGAGPGEALLAGTSLSEAAFLEAEASGIRWVQVLTVGLEDVMSPAIENSEVVLTTVGGFAVDTIAEFVFARVLGHAKRFEHLAELQAGHRWEAMTQLARLRGATLTVVGLGPIGTRVAELGHAFGMRVVGVRRRPDAGAGPCNEVVGPDELVEVAGASDYLVLAIPLTPATRGIVAADVLRALKPSCLLVNVGRGPLVDESALLEALHGGRVHAALDVVTQEPLSKDSPLWGAPGLVLSPHCSSIAPGLFDELAGIAVDNIERFQRGESVLNQVDKSAGYPVRA